MTTKPLVPASATQKIRSSILRRIDLASLLTSSSNVAMFADKVALMTERLGELAFVELERSRVSLVFSSINILLGAAEWLELPAAASSGREAQQLVGNLGRVDRIMINRDIGRRIVASCHHLATSMTAELGKHHTYILMPPEAALIEHGPAAFGLEVLDTFPEVRQDVSAAAQCRAYELWTACVMHLMRVGEVGIGRLADHVQAPRGSSWGATAANLTKTLEGVRRVDGDGSAKQWLSEAAVYLNFVKNGFRNPAMHPEMSFDRGQALAIFDNTGHFMQLIAKRLKA